MKPNEKPSPIVPQLRISVVDGIRLLTVRDFSYRNWLALKRRTVSAFTLTELLIAIAVLVLVLVMMVQVVSGISQSTRTQNQQMDAVAEGRRALDAIELDFSHAVISDTSSVLVPTESITANNMLFAMITRRRGPEAQSNHRFLAVHYKFGNNTLIRQFRSIPFSESGLFGAMTTGTFHTPNKPLAKGILAVAVRGLRDDASFYSMNPTVPDERSSTSIYNGISVPINYAALITQRPAFAATLTNRTRSLELWVAVVDSQNYQLLQTANLLGAVKSSVESSSSPAEWRQKIDANQEIPPQVKSGIRILNRTISLP